MGNGGETKNEGVVSASLILHASRFQFRAATMLGNFFAPFQPSLLAGDHCPTNSRVILSISLVFIVVSSDQCWYSSTRN